MAEHVTLAEAVERGMTHHRAGRLVEAEGIYREILSQLPDEPEVLHLLGYLASQTGRHGAAVELISRAIAIDPAKAKYFDTLGNALRAMGRAAEAVEALRRAAELEPGNYEVHNNLGNALTACGRMHEAIESYRRALELAPGSVEIQCNIAIAAHKSGQSDDAIELYQAAIATNAKVPQVYHNLAILLIMRCQQDEAARLFRKALELKPDYRGAHETLLMSLHYQAEQDPDAIFQEHLRWARQHARPPATGIALHGNDRTLDRPLRIGYVSPDFRKQSINFFLEGLLEHHDRNRFHVICYADELNVDEVTQRMRGLCSSWRSIRGMSDADLAGMVRDDRVDILIDLAGHTGYNRLLAFAYKPAPVQVSFLGYPDTSGLETMNYRLTDSLADPAGMTEAYHAEKLLRVDSCAWCYRPPEESLNLSPGLADGSCITFGSFNLTAKITPAVIAAWSDILKAVEGSRLLLKSRGLDDAGVRRCLVDLFAGHGIGPDRLELLGQLPGFADHLRVYQKIDIALDPFPYNGTTTTCEAMWMGVPVVTLAGKIHASRVGVSLLSNVGLRELIAENVKEYVDIAAALANNRPRLAEMKQSMRSRMKSSPLMDAPGYARKIEAAYREMWRTWCGGK